MKIIITVPRVPPSPNDTKWRHPMAKMRLRKLWKQELFYGAVKRERDQMIADAQKYRMRVEISIHHPRITDDDNCAASLKPVLDGLKNLGFIANDSPDKLELALPVSQVFSDEKKTVITISPKLS